MKALNINSAGNLAGKVALAAAAVATAGVIGA